jgi:hypothetical protein
MRSRQIGDEALLDEAISLEREALHLRPLGHPDRAINCSNLASMLIPSMNRQDDKEIFDECLALTKEALALRSVDHPDKWRSQMILAKLNLHPHYGCRDFELILRMTLEAVSHNASDLPALLADAAYFLHQVDIHYRDASIRGMLIQCYSAVIDLALLVAGFVLDHSSQLQYLNRCRYLASGACVAAITVGDVNRGLELLERARGVVWTQSLHLRDPQLQDLESVKPDMAHELDTLLRNLGTRHSGHDSTISHHESIMMLTPFLHERDMRHQAHGRIQRLVRDIHEISGFENFMRGPSHDALLRTATTHPVVVLVAAGEECHALIIRSPEEAATSIPLPRIRASEITASVLEQSTSRLRGSNRDMNDNTRLGLKNSKTSAFHRMLTLLWDAVVKPIIEHLGLNVSTLMSVLLDR